MTLPALFNFTARSLDLQTSPPCLEKLRKLSPEIVVRAAKPLLDAQRSSRPLLSLTELGGVIWHDIATDTIGMRSFETVRTTRRSHHQYRFFLPTIQAILLIYCFDTSTVAIDDDSEH